MRITGQMMNYYLVCARKLWYFAHDLGMEENHENVEIGALIDQTTYVRDCKHIMIDDLINIDFIRSGRLLHEIKKSRKMEDADVLQIKYYLYYLKQRGVTGLSGRIDYPLLKKTLDVQLTDEDEKKLEEIIQNVEAIISAPIPPTFEKKRYCKSCSYCELCMI